MKKISLLLLLAVSAAVVAGDALAKGPIEATIDGPGLSTPIQIGDWESFGQEGALANDQPIMQLAEASGFFLGAFGQPALTGQRPTDDLGPRYVVAYRIPGPSNDEFRLVQYLYPYAEPSPVTHMAAGQRIFGRQGTPGGWYVADDPNLPQLLPVLVEAGLPETSPTTAPDGGSLPWAVVLVSALLGTVLVAAVVLGVRRRHQPAVS